MKKKAQPTKSPIAPCFPYPGGKTRLLAQILPLIPEHRQYVEPFAGGLALLLAKERCPVEVVNDVDSELANFYRYVRLHRDALFFELEHAINSREDFYLLKDNPGMTDLQRAVRWFLLKVNSFGGMSGTYGRGKHSFHGFERTRHFAKINEVADRLERVVIENQDWEETVKFYDDPRTFVFFDPPYVNCGKTAYNAFTEFDMERVRARLDKLKSMWLLTCDDSPQCRRIFDGLPFKTLSIKYSTARTTAKRKTYSEMLVMSPRLAKEIKAA